MLITISNIHNPLNNIKFTKEKRVKKKLPNTWFFESKVLYKKKKGKEKEKEKMKINHSTVHTLNTNYYLKYLYST